MTRELTGQVLLFELFSCHKICNSEFSTASYTKASISPMASVCKATSLHLLLLAPSSAGPIHPLSQTPPPSVRQNSDQKKQRPCAVEHCPFCSSLLCLSKAWLNDSLPSLFSRICGLWGKAQTHLTHICVPQEPSDDNSRKHRNMCQVQSWALDLSGSSKCDSIYDPVTKMICV